MAKQRDSPDEVERLLRAFAADEQRHVFVTGPGGTGKSRNTVVALLSLIHEKKIAFTAFTGVAAVNLRRFLPCEITTKTLHSWLRITPSGPQKRRRHYGYDCEYMKQTDILMIDEVSMIPSKLFDEMDAMLQTIRHNSTPFGGIRLVMVGDMKQLAPIRDRNIMHSSIWKVIRPLEIVFDTPHRFSADPSWAKLLDRVRENRMTREDKILINSRKKSSHYIEKWEKIHKRPIPRIYCRRQIVDEYNLKKMQELPSETTAFDAIDLTVYQGAAALSDGSRRTLLANLSVQLPSRVEVKIGAFMMITYNLDTAKGIVNGTTGIVERIDKDVIVLRDKNQIPLPVTRAEITELHANGCGVSRRQFPLVLAYAFTVHKAQGSEFDRVVLHIDPTAFFAGGHLYTMLSRACTLRSIFLTGPGLQIGRER